MQSLCHTMIVQMYMVVKENPSIFHDESGHNLKIHLICTTFQNINFELTTLTLYPEHKENMDSTQLFFIVNKIYLFASVHINL